MFALLAIEGVIKLRFCVYFAVVNVNGWKEQRLQVASRKRKRHGMNLRRAGLEFEDGASDRFDHWPSGVTDHGPGQ